MAEIRHPLYSEFTVDTATAVKDPTMPLWTYKVTVDGESLDLPEMSVSPEDMLSGHGDDLSCICFSTFLQS